MRNVNELDDLYWQLELELNQLRSKTDEASKQQWREKRGELAKVEYEIFESHEKERPSRAVLSLWRSAEIGCKKSRDRLFGKTPEEHSAPLEKNLADLNASVLFAKGLQALSGVGVACNRGAALHYFWYADAKGHTFSTNIIGEMYHRGLGVSKDKDKAIHYFLKAAERGSITAKASLGYIWKHGGIPQGDAQGLSWLREAAEGGSADAQGELGKMYHWGELGLPQDYLLAVHWFRQAADQGGHTGQYMLANMYIRDQVRIHSDQAVEYRRDIEKRGIENNSYRGPYYGPRALLRRVSESGDFNANYHLAMLEKRENLFALIARDPNEFLVCVMQDSLLNEEAHLFWLEQLLENHYRSKRLLETTSSFNRRPKLDEENLVSITMKLATTQYARLSQLAKGKNEIEVNGEIEKVCVDVTKIEEAKESIDSIMKLLNTIPVNSEHYSEAQFILAHLNFMMDKKGEQWDQHLTACRNSDPEEKWMGSQDGLLNRAYLHTLEILKAYQKASEQENPKELKKELRQSEITIISQNKYALMPLLRLSVMTEKPEKRLNYLVSAKALDDNFSETTKWLDRLKNDNAISTEIHDAISEDINTLRR